MGKDNGYLERQIQSFVTEGGKAPIVTPRNARKVQRALVGMVRSPQFTQLGLSAEVPSGIIDQLLVRGKPVREVSHIHPRLRFEIVATKLDRIMSAEDGYDQEILEVMAEDMRF